MICYFKAAIRSIALQEFLRKHDLLNFASDVCITTGEILSSIERAEFNGLTFELFINGYTRIRGSLHIFFNNIVNNENTNHTQFTLNNVKYCLEYIKENFQIDISKAKLSNLEYGLNLKVPSPVKNYMGSFLAYKQFPLIPMRSSFRNFGKEACFGEYTVKIYNKCLQNNIPENILRIEIRIKKMRKLNSGLMLGDIINPELWNVFFKTLTSSIDDLVIMQEIDTKRLSKASEILYIRCQNPNFWLGLNKKQRSQKKTLFNKLLQTHCENDLKKDIKNLMSQTFQELCY